MGDIMTTVSEVSDLFAWTHRVWADLRAQSIVVDGVSYTVPAIRQFILERYELASALAVAQGEAERLAEKNRRLSDQLRRNGLHLQKRTAALVRLIGRGS